MELEQVCRFWVFFLLLFFVGLEFESYLQSVLLWLFWR
jgi:hypothetical protein